MFLSGEELEDYVKGIIHEETQIADRGLDLTVSKICRPTSAAELDFGGSEEKTPDLRNIKPERRSPEDDYGWWNLEAGIYIIGFNEDITVDEGLAAIVPLRRLTSGGSFHPPVIFSGELSDNVILSVNSSGLKIKENARLSRLIVWR